MEMNFPSDPPQPFRLRIEDYELLDRSGVFEGQRVELIDGVIIAVNAELLPHTRVKNELMFRLRLALGAMGLTLETLVEPTLALPPGNMPQPDVVVAQVPRVRDYLRVENLAIVIEVGASTLRSDLGVKKALYALHAVPEYWVVDVEARRLHQFWAPDDGQYVQSLTTALASELRSATVAGLVIDGNGIL
ncbi:Uma2 family endonuclease [Sphingomonas mollis]|uniref:Uma2 family endonuclease n=1 Tax=Sphingomonas mollis TaxID=2795726 RepID=A0ABS0XUG1_9SPHN|nr:Uma2 family endonuclease [Sphingomonas sp. BT553]MBJ6123686.1 Uma2 family endonuclease [Sphingomonas sp. BT553]